MSIERANVDAADEAGRAALFEGEPRTVHLSLSADQRVPAHDHPDRQILFHVLEGEIALDLDDETHDLSAGDVLRFDGDCQISPKAVSDARALVVLAKA
ncbi:Cupin domain-containing protein [Halomicrobium zhouii]|uniref:Cupin domain-containing protein n=1 Tax=Halomicrobium zhouii TaxID=767519 RepID=A0A1I6K1L2_9EURY|nr:cupin domain-containing protein [Halomicrobium zhouii]SFR85142.1 Cupin domain-containing protein [Halomicrobium zhouii]